MAEEMGWVGGRGGGGGEGGEGGEREWRMATERGGSVTRDSTSRPNIHEAEQFASFLIYTD